MKYSKGIPFSAKNLFITLAFSLSGSLSLAFFSTIQKATLGYPITIAGIFVPVAFGFSSGLVVGIFFILLKMRNKDLENLVNNLDRLIEEQTLDLASKNRALEIQEKRFRDIVFFNPDAQIVVSGRNRILFFNPPAEELFELSEKSLCEECFSEFRQGHTLCVDSKKGRRCMESFVNEILWADETASLISLRDITNHKIMQEELERLASTDQLTGIANRRRFLEEVENEFQRCKRYNLSFAFLMIDIDHFKKINDSYGHEAGDKVLIDFCNICVRDLRTTDNFGRLGGEEFGILLPQTDCDRAINIAERLRQSVELFSFPISDNFIKVTVSIGCTTLDSKDNSPKDIMKRADKALYEAKQYGRNRLVMN
jgi:diguanylate cyclase (GGDEF)-like protein